VLDTQLREARAATGRVPIVLADFPIGRSGDWWRPRFPLRRAQFLDLLPPRSPEIDGDPRLLLMARHPQMLYQVQPDVYELDLRLGGGVSPALVSLMRQPLPPLAPLAAAEAVEPAWTLLVAVSSSIGDPTLSARAAAPEARWNRDRIQRFRRLNPELQPVARVQGGWGPAFDFYRLEQPTRLWRGLDVRFGGEMEAAGDPARAWAMPQTLWAPWLGYGFTHAFLDAVDERFGKAPVQRGLMPPLRVGFAVAVPPGRYRGVVRMEVACDETHGPLEVEGVLLGGGGPVRCAGPRRDVERDFEVDVRDGRLNVWWTNRPDGVDPWSITGLRFEPAAAVAAP